MRLFTRSDLAGSKSYIYAIMPIYKNDGHILYVQASTGADPISETIDSAADFVSGAFSGKPRRDPDALKKLEQLKNLRDSGVLSEEEYEKMKADLMERF